jgi:hypothetical protein
MNPADTLSGADETSRRPPERISPDSERRPELAPITLESLVTWDVCGHAQREKDRMNSACRVRGATEGGY